MKNFTILLIFTLGVFLYGGDELFSFGMNHTIYGEFNDTPPGYCAIYERTLDSSASIGIKWWRGMKKFTWISVEENQGVYDWEDEDSLVKWTGERNIHVLPVIGYMYPSWAYDDIGNIPDSIKGRYPFDNWSEYKDFTQAMAERYDGDGTNDMPGLILPINYWECMNEPYNTLNFLGDFERYADIFDSTRVALKRANPNAKLGGPCLISGRTAPNNIWEYYDPELDSIIDTTMLTTDMLITILDYIDTIDFITHHIYQDPDDFMESLEDIRETVGEYLPIWITECGYQWYKWWHHPYTSGNPGDSNVFDNKWSFYDEYYPDSDIILIADTAQIYWVDTTTDSFNYSKAAQANKYNELLGSLKMLLNEESNYKFFFFSMALLTSGKFGVSGGGYDTVYDSVCVEGVCSLWVHNLLINDPLWDENLSYPLCVMRRNFNHLPAFDTIRNSILPSDLYLAEYIDTNETKTYQAMNSITANDFTIEGNGSSGGTVAMEAGEKIYLGDGFKVKKGGYFYGSTNPLYGGGTGFSSMKGIAIPKGIKASNESVSKNSIPKIFSCNQNFPNPFASSTTIKYGLPKDVEVKLDIYNLIGQKVRTLVDGQQSAGYKSVSWDSRTSAGKEAPQGIYFYTFEAGNFTKHRKMILLK